MPTITVRAPSSSHAMQQVAAQLGDDAYILSTAFAEGQVVITATDDPEDLSPSNIFTDDGMAPRRKAAAAGPGTKPAARAVSARPVSARPASARSVSPRPVDPRPVDPRPQSDPAQSDPAQSARAGADDRATARPVSEPAPRPARAADQTPPSRPVAAEAADPAPMRAVGQAATPRPLRPGAAEAPMPTAPAAGTAPVSVPVSAPVSGPMSPSAPTPAPGADLAARLVHEGAPALLAAARVAIVGPVGGGRSLAALKIAAERLATWQERTALVAPQGADDGGPDTLRRFARIMGLALRLPALSGSLPALPERCVLDMPGTSPAGTETLRLWMRELTRQPGSQGLLALPAGLHPALVARECALWAPFRPAVLLTRVDLVTPSPEELEAIAAAGLRIAFVTGTRDVADALVPMTAAHAAHWLAGKAGLPRIAARPARPIALTAAAAAAAPERARPATAEAARPAPRGPGRFSAALGLAAARREATGLEESAS